MPTYLPLCFSNSLNEVKHVTHLPSRFYGLVEGIGHEHECIKTIVDLI